MNDNTLSPYPNDLTEAEYRELAVQSAIHPALIALNFLHISGEAAYEYLFTINVPRKNAGRVTDSFLKRYKHVELGGLWISGLDPLNNWQPMEWGRFKPTYPRTNENGKSVKYESQPATPNRVTYFDIPPYIWDLVAQRYSIKRYHSSLALRLQDRMHPLEFWEWVQKHPEIPVILCEGEKKAACLLSLGFVAIALPGIWNGRVGKKDFDERLHPDLLPLAQKGRKFIILFDYETKPSTRWSVFQATLRTGKAIEAAGCACEVAVLPGMEKGVDDFVVARGKDANAALTAIIDDARNLKDYHQSFFQKRRGLSSRHPANVTINAKYLTQALGFESLDEELFGKLVIGSDVNQQLPPFPTPAKPKFMLPSSGLVALCSDMGTGKTELLAKWREQNPNVKFLNTGHRVNLLKNLANRLQTAVYSSLKQGELATVAALSITIDSLHKLNTQYLQYGCVFIDEACQYLTHLLLSKTCKEHRGQILEVLEYIVYNAQLVVIADAHMDDITVDFFMAMRPALEKPYIVLNEFKNGGRNIYWYEGDNSSALVANISAAILSRKKVMVVSDSKKFIKKYEYSLQLQGISCNISDSTELESSGEIGSESGNQTQSYNLYSGHSPVKVWSIHSDNSGSDENIAFIKDITNEVKNIDVLLTSPSLGTGVDIPEYHFDEVFGVFHGVSQTATECSQQLYRYRPIVPIHVWVAPRPPFGYKETNATKIKKRLLETNEINAFLIKIDRETGKRGVEKDWALDAYCQLLACRHQSINNLRADLQDLLVNMGNTIIPMGDSENEAVNAMLKAVAGALDAAHYEAVAQASDISDREYCLSKSKDYLSPEEVFECEKYRIKDSYGMPVTDALVEKDDGGRLIKAITCLEGLLADTDETVIDPNTGKQYPLPPEIVAQRDLTERLNLPLCFDWKNHSAAWLARYRLGLSHILRRLINGEEITAADPVLPQMMTIAKQYAPYLKAILGFTIPQNCEPIWLLGTLLGQLGLKLTSRKVGPRGKQVKYFSLAVAEWEFATAVLSHRAAKRAQKEERTRQRIEEQAKYRAGIQAQYGVAPPKTPVSTPPPNCIGEPPLGGGDTTNNSSQESEVGEGWEPNDGDSTPIRVTLLQLLAAIGNGVEAVKTIFSQWTTQRRWCVLQLLEDIAANELRKLELLIPDFYVWFSQLPD